LNDREPVLQEQISHLRAMLEISRILNSTLDHSRLLRIIVRSATQVVDCEDSSILLIDARTGELRFEACAGLEEQATQPIVVPMDASIAGWIARHNKPLIISDVHSDPRFFEQADDVTGFPTRSVLGVPMSSKGRVIGVLEAVNKREGEFSDEDVERLAVLAAQAAVAIENARLHTELQRAYEELNELDRLKSEFITATSHELRTPLTVIKGYLQLATNAMLPPERRVAMLETISRQVDKIVRLANDLFFMQEMNTIRLEFAEVNMTSIVRSQVDANRSRAKAAGIHLICDVAPELPPVWGDAERLDRAFHNLLDNAIKFSPDGGDVAVSLYIRDETAYLEISDPGVGIPPAEQLKIFERFYRLERVGDRLFDGLGLGLAITKHIVEEHGGTISVASEPGQGSTFTMTLPLKTAST
jgi:signal transduction histidine kinase